MVVLLVLESNRSIFASVTFPFNERKITDYYLYILYLYLLKNTKYCDILVLLANSSEDC